MRCLYKNPFVLHATVTKMLQCVPSHAENEQPWRNLSLHASSGIAENDREKARAERREETSLKSTPHPSAEESTASIRLQTRLASPD